MRLSPYDEASLSWYFGEGQACFERSTMGAQLDRLALFGMQHAPSPELVAARAEWREQPWLEPPGALTARPRAESRQSSGYTPDETALSRFARVSRRLREVGAVDALSAAVLAAYYGDQGARWGRLPQGRVFAVAPLTEAGFELLRRASSQGTARLGACADDQIAAEVQVQAVQPAKGRALLVEKARRQGLALYDRACAVWYETDARRGGSGMGRSAHGTR